MYRKAGSGMILTLLLMSILALEFNIQPIKAEPRTWTVDDGGPADFHTIQEAINAANPGDTIYVYNGTYYENLIVGKVVTIIGENKEMCIVDGSRISMLPVIRVFSDNVCISGFTIQNSGIEMPGIYLYHSNNTVIQSNNIIRNRYSGIYVNGCGNTIVGNRITHNRWGIHLDGSDKNNITSNNITNNHGYGIRLSNSCSNVLRDNSLVNNDYGFRVHGYDLSHFIQDIDVSNTVDGMPIVYWVNEADKQVPVNAGYVAIINSTRITVKDLDLTMNGQGVLFVYTTNSTIESVNVMNKFSGIHLHMSHFNTVTRNNITKNDAGIWLEGSCYNSIRTSEITDNHCGVFGRGFDGNNIVENNVINNDDGLRLDYSNDNTIIRNRITNNQFDGIDLRYSKKNRIYHNNFINNVKQTYIYNSTNTWDNGYPSGGNYWSDYTSVDLYSGPYQNETGSDGIGDTSYIIDANNIDHYPLMKPTPEVLAVAIDIHPEALNLRSRGKWITTYIELPEGYNVSYIDVSTIMLSDTIPAESHPVDIGDEDGDGIPDLMVKFNRYGVSEHILGNIDIEVLVETRMTPYGRMVTIMPSKLEVKLKVTGTLADGTPFEASDTITVLLFDRPIRLLL